MIDSDKICMFELEWIKSVCYYLISVQGSQGKDYSCVSFGSAPQHKTTQRSKISKLSAIRILICCFPRFSHHTFQPVYSVFILKYYSITHTPHFFESTDTVQDGAAVLQLQNKMSLRWLASRVDSLLKTPMTKRWQIMEWKQHDTLHIWRLTSSRGLRCSLW